MPVGLPFTVVGRSLLQNAVADAMLDEKGTPCVSVPTRLGLPLEEFTPSPTPPPLSPNGNDCRQPPSTVKLGKRTMVTVLTRISSSTNLDEATPKRIGLFLVKNICPRLPLWASVDKIDEW